MFYTDFFFFLKASHKIFPVYATQRREVLFLVVYRRNNYLQIFLSNLSLQIQPPLIALDRPQLRHFWRCGRQNVRKRSHVCRTFFVGQESSKIKYSKTFWIIFLFKLYCLVICHFSSLAQLNMPFIHCFQSAISTPKLCQNNL